MISAAIIDGSGRLAASSRDSSRSQKISRLTLSRAIRSSYANRLNRSLSSNKPDTLRYARILLETGTRDRRPHAASVRDAALCMRDALSTHKIESIPVLDGHGGPSTTLAPRATLGMTCERDMGTSFRPHLRSWATGVRERLGKLSKRASHGSCCRLPRRRSTSITRSSRLSRAMSREGASLQ